MRISRVLRHLFLRASCPELFDDAWASSTLERCRARLDGRNIALVGNAQSLLMGRELGSLIDDSDVVVRLNRGVISQPKKQGQRTDLLAVACDISFSEAQRQFGAPQVIWLSPLRVLMSADMVKARRQIALVPQS